MLPNIPEPFLVCFTVSERTTPATETSRLSFNSERASVSVFSVDLEISEAYLDIGWLVT